MDIPQKNGHYDLNWMIENIQKYQAYEKDKWGPKMWALLEYIISFIPCGNCAKHGDEMITFEHDIVNIHTGKPIHDIKLFKKYLDDILEAIKQYDTNTGKPLSNCKDGSCEHIAKVEVEMR